MSNRGRHYWYKNKGKRKRSDVEAGDSRGGPGPSKKRPSDMMESNRNAGTFPQNVKKSMYDNWEFYFPDEDYRKGSSTEKKIQAMEEFITLHQDLFPITNLENDKPYNVDVNILCKNDAFMIRWNTFKEDIFNNPKHTLNSMSIAIDQTMIDIIKQREGMDDPKMLMSLPKAVARVSNYGPVIPLRDLKVNSYADYTVELIQLDKMTKQDAEEGSFLWYRTQNKFSRIKIQVKVHGLDELSWTAPNFICDLLKMVDYPSFAINIDCCLTQKLSCLGKLISIRGCIMRVGSIKHFAQFIEYSCMSCSYCTVVRQVDGIYSLPTKCIACNGKKFRPVLSSQRTKTVLFQVIRMQEHFGDEQDDKGRRPRTIDVDLIEDLVSTCMPGDDITVTGIIKVRGNETRPSNSKGRINSNVFSLYMEAVYLLNNKYKSQNKCTVGFDLTEMDYNAIREIYHGPNVFKLLVHSLCPSIYGHDIIKAGLLLSLFGGNTKTHDVRDDIHILVFGDPGLGKSQLLQACARVAPKGVFVCGSSSTSTGLTATLVKDNSTGDFVLEPGALVMADKGCCCIDEFDKMPTQHQALLEAMEQQSVSLAKSGMVCCLPARTSILAAANPAGGRYNRSKTIIENLNMSSPLLSRFDLIFILLDQPNEQLDDLLSEHIMAVHARTNSQMGDAGFRSRNSGSPTTRSENTLRQKLSLLPTDSIDPIPHRILRNYILYAKQYVKPTITPAAVEVLQNFYLKCRAKNDNTKITPMTPRQLGALIRLTEARSKLELREEATQNDALEVVQIIEYSMADVAVEPVVLDNSMFSKSGKLTANKVKAFINLLTQHANAEGNNLFTMTEMKDIARRNNLVTDDFNSLISKLNENGVILKKGPQLYSLILNN